MTSTSTSTTKWGNRRVSEREKRRVEGSRAFNLVDWIDVRLILRKLSSLKTLFCCSSSSVAIRLADYNSASCYSATQTISVNPSNSSDITLTTMPRGIDLSKFRGDSDSEDEAFPPVKKQIVLDSFKQQTFSHGIQKKTKKELEKEEEERKRKQEEV